MKTHYQNRLPHIAPIGGTFFVTFRQNDSLPQALVKQLKADLALATKRIEKENLPDKDQRIQAARKHNFGQYEHQLDLAPFGSCELRVPQIAGILIEKVNEYHHKLIDLQAMCIMPNHVHMLFSMAPQMLDAAGEWRTDIPEDYVQLDKVMQLIKGGSSRQINQYRGESGTFWCKDSYDHFVRHDQEWLSILHYILHNPVKAGLVSQWAQWPHTIISAKVLETYTHASTQGELREGLLGLWSPEG